MTDDLDFTPKERGQIRLEFRERFGQTRSLNDGLLVKRRVTGPGKGAPKPNIAVQSMIDRGFLTLNDDGAHWLRARFTPKGIEALQRMAQDRRYLPPEEYASLIAELEKKPF